MTLCTLEQRDGAYYCTRCNGLPLKGNNYKRQCPASNGRVPKPDHVDAAEFMTALYAKEKLTSPPLAEILAKLERCRSAGCNGLQDDVCVALGSSSCKQRAAWFAKLSGNTNCPHWLPVTSLSPEL